MELLINALNKDKVKKVLNTKPWEEGFSLVELVVVIAVLAILAAVAIPAFQGVQARAKTAAVKNGMVNGVKECIVKISLPKTFLNAFLDSCSNLYLLSNKPLKFYLNCI